jgi:hypothetical protein
MFWKKGLLQAASSTLVHAMSKDFVCWMTYRCVSIQINEDAILCYEDMISLQLPRIKQQWGCIIKNEDTR